MDDPVLGDITLRAEGFGLSKRARSMGSASARSACGPRVPSRYFGLLFQAFRPRFVDAEWFLIQIISGGGIRARAAAHADVAELAAAALSLQIVNIAQLVEDERVLPNVGERLLAQIPRQCRQVATGIDLAPMRNETYCGSGQASLGHGVHIGGMSARMSHCLADALRLQLDSGRAWHRHLSSADSGRFVPQRPLAGRTLRRFNYPMGSLSRSRGTMLRNPALANHSEVMRSAGRLKLDAAFQ